MWRFRRGDQAVGTAGAKTLVSEYARNSEEARRAGENSEEEMGGECRACGSWGGL